MPAITDRINPAEGVPLWERAMPANELPPEITSFSSRKVRTNDCKPTVTKTPALVVRPGGVLLILCGLATAAIDRGVSKIQRVLVEDRAVR
jgi:hypothetical protein